MKAFQSVRAEMREACLGITSPTQCAADAPARLSRPAEDEDAETHIEPWMQFAFLSLIHASETRERFVLVSCFMNEEPAVIIAAGREDGSRMQITPLFMAVQPWMSFTPHTEDGGQEGGGPDRAAANDAPAPR